MTLHIPFSWAERRPAWLDQFLYIPKAYELHADWPILPLFGNDAPICIEYCSGNGQWIVEKASQDPGRNWIAVEHQFIRAKQIWTKGRKLGLSNLYVVCGDALAFTRYYILENSVEEIFVNFPDPWPKRHHARHRLIQPSFLDALARIVQGRGMFVTDDPPYAAQMVQVVGGSADWQFSLKAPHYCSEWPGYGSSFFEALWKQKGKTLHYIPFERNK